MVLNFVTVRPFSGARSKCMAHHIRPTLEDGNPDTVIIHAGTNDLTKIKNTKDVADSIMNLAHEVIKVCPVIVSCVVPRNDTLKKKALDVNIHLKKMCIDRNILFISHENIDPKIHLDARDKLHLNSTGTALLSDNFVKILEKC